LPDSIRARARRVEPGVALALILALPGLASAARPLDTEDTGTAERVEVEIGATYQTASDGDAGQLGIAINVGVLVNLEVNAQGTLTVVDPPDAGARGGVGDTVLGVKYRVFDETPPWPALLGRLTLRLPTGDEARGLGAEGTDVGLLLAASRTLGTLTLTVNVGYTITTSGAEADVVTLAGSVEWVPSGVWRLAGEIVGEVPVGRNAVGTAVVRVGGSWDVFASAEARAVLRRVTMDGAIGVGLTSASPDVVATVGVTLGF
jgi:Putative MetA-pathway of phenol degradation